MSATPGKKGKVSVWTADVHWITNVLRHPATAWIALAGSLIVTALAWYLSDQFAVQRARDRFEYKTEDIEKAISRRMTEYEEVLRGGLGLFKTIPNVTRSQWRDYVSALEVDRYYPGLQGIGFSMMIPSGKTKEVISQVRSEGYPQFDVHPVGQRSETSAIVYLEPLKGRNLRAFGYDMFSEPVRREAMARARDTGNVAISGVVTLVQETKEDVQRGFLMYLPVYQRGMPINSVEERRSALRGYVYSPFRTNDLMSGILGSSSANIDFEIFDGEKPDPSRLLYDSDRSMQLAAVHLEQDHTRFVMLPIGGRVWGIRFASNPDYVTVAEESQPLVVAIGGVAIDLLLFFSIASIARQYKRAEISAKHAAAKLAQKEEQFRAVSDTANDGIVTADSSGLIVYLNKSAEDMFEISANDAAGQPLTILMPPQFHSAHTAGFSNFIKTGASKIIGRRVEITGRRKSGADFPLEISLAAWTANNKMYFTAHLRDITDRKRVERLKNEFVSTVSHEMRTPLTAIHGSLALVASGATGALPAQAAELVNVARDSSERLVRLTNDMLDLQKMETGKLAFDIRPLNVSELVRSASSSNESFVKQHGAVLECKCPDEDLFVVGDADRVIQVLTNLISNAAKYSPSLGVVTVSIEVREKLIRFLVTDQGPGVPDDFRARMFEKFAQADSSDTRQKGGTGLGLSISRMLIERMDGYIGLASDGPGTTFYFELPRARSSYRYVYAS